MSLMKTKEKILKRVWENSYMLREEQFRGLDFLNQEGQEEMQANSAMLSQYKCPLVMKVK